MGLWLVQESLRTWADAGAPGDLAACWPRRPRLPALSRVIDPDDPSLLPPGDQPARIAALCARAAGSRRRRRRAELVRTILDSLALAYRRAVRAAASCPASRST